MRCVATLTTRTCGAAWWARLGWCAPLLLATCWPPLQLLAPLSKLQLRVM
jgi:hypothetical protein